jgi:hypothetical protein
LRAYQINSLEPYARGSTISLRILYSKTSKHTQRNTKPLKNLVFELTFSSGSLCVANFFMMKKVILEFAINARTDTDASN